MSKAKHLIAAAAVVTVVSSQGASAGNEDGQFVVRGIGSQQCAYLNTDYPQSKTKQVELSSWIGGYVTHANKSTTDLFDLIPYANIGQFAGLVAVICKSKPTVQVQAIVDALASRIAPYHVSEQGGFDVVKSETHQVEIRPETIKDVQGLLAAQGYLDKQDVDGAFGPTTSGAISAFQKKANMKQTGVPDTLTLYRLLEVKS